ncbi:MAG: ATP-binding protein [Clostridiales bacterium]|nr:ATP-binding protein [Clostridiales bacterium]
MTKRIFRSISLASFIVFIACAVLFFGVLYNYFSEMQLDALKSETLLAAQGVESGGIDYLNELEADNFRVSWIASDGTVIYDSEANELDMENHLDRDEVKDALLYGYGECVRYSDTLLEIYQYSAKLLSDGSVLRLAATYNSPFVLLYGMLQPICIITAVIIILGLVMALSFSKKVVKPLNDLDLEKPLQNNACSEIMPLLSRIDAQQKKIEQQKQELYETKRQFDSAASNMREGMVLLNGGGMVLSINPAAQRFLGKELTAGCSISGCAERLHFDSILKKAGSGEPGEKTIPYENGKYKMTLNPIMSENGAAGAVLLLFDITKEEEAEQLRREFTANVSHELKTPLHTISGCAELMANEMVKEKDISRFSKEIYNEAQRMICLIDDIIKLSHLDEGSFDAEFEPVRLDKLARHTAESLLKKAESADVKIKVTAQKCVINAVPHLAESIIYNLCDNAIKYNKPGGKVNITVKYDGCFAKLSVKDTGIGIPPEYQERIFERFWRVDKSHSKEIGGTGLGLSIVKHAAKLHSAEISLDSEPGSGTTIIVSFPAAGVLQPGANN